MHYSYSTILSFILFYSWKNFICLLSFCMAFVWIFWRWGPNLFAKKSGERRKRRDRIQNRLIGIEYAEMGIYCGESCGNVAHIYVIRHTGGEKCKETARIQHVLQEERKRPEDRRWRNISNFITTFHFFAISRKNGWLVCWVHIYLIFCSRFLSGSSVFDYLTWLAGYVDAKTLRDWRGNSALARKQRHDKATK